MVAGDKNTKMLLMGNEAIARGAVEAGISLATAYPGTPSSEILATLAKFAKQFNYSVEWSVNEKVALEVAAGASFAGARTIVAMKQVGLNVAADPLMTLAYLGIKGGMVIVVADDPGPHSSQNEQDTRSFAKFAKLPVFDPSTPQEAKEMTYAAFALSEELQLPVIVRPTTRVSHTCAEVTLGQINAPKEAAGFVKDPNWVAFPKHAYNKHIWLLEQQTKMRETFNNSSFNYSELKGDLGIIASGVSYAYVQEALALFPNEISVLKIGTPYPLPEEPVVQFLKHCKRVLIIEELDPLVEEQVIAIAWKYNLQSVIMGKLDGLVPGAGEFNVDIVRNALTKAFNLPTVTELQTATDLVAQPVQLPARSPILCSGCPHRASFYAFKEAVKGTDAVFCGDIGCYTLGVSLPLNMLDTCLCMGGSITIASGLNYVEPQRKQIAFIGDSTFFHTGVAGLINAVYNKANIVIVVLDNRTTAMTGHQPHPGTAVTATNERSPEIKIEDIAAACGVQFIKKVDPYNLPAAVAVAKEAINHKGLAVVIMRRECVKIGTQQRKRYLINQEKCTRCRVCLKKFGCPGIAGADAVMINEKCSGCGVCLTVCPFGAIEEVR